MPLRSYRASDDTDRLMRIAAGAAGQSVQAWMDDAVRAQLERQASADKTGPVAAAMRKAAKKDPDLAATGPTKTRAGRQPQPGPHTNHHWR